jgi:hypothetical protein
MDPQHLQRIIEKQPSCLVRAGIDGVLLAVNDAALGLLGARELGQVLGTPLTARIVPEHHELWKAFAATIAADASRSLECDLTDLTGARRTVLFHGVPLLDHPDGIPSMMLGARDVSVLRGIESSQRQVRPQPDPTADHEKQRALAEREQLEQLLKAGRKHLQLQRAQLAEAAAERQRLETLLQENQSAHQRAIDEQAELQRALTVQHQLDLQSAAQAAQQSVDGLRTQVTEAAAERQRLETLLRESERAHQRAIDEQVELQRALTVRHQLDLQTASDAAQQQLDEVRTHLIQQHQLDHQLAEQEARHLIDGLRTQLTEAAADRQRLEAALAQRDVQLIEELAAERARVDGILADAGLKQRQMAQALADQGVELHYTELTAKQLAPLAVAGRLALEVGAELQCVVEAMDARAALLLADCPPDGAFREVVEALRGDAIRARSLTRQIERAPVETQTESSHS